MNQLVAAPPKKALYFVQAKQYPPCFTGVQTIFASEENLEFKIDISISEIKAVIASGQKCLVVLCMNDRDEVGAVANALLSFKKEIKERRVIAVVFMKFASDKVEELLVRTGCSDTLKFDVSVKAFAYKLKRYLKLLDQGQAQEDTLALIGGKKVSENLRGTQVKAQPWGNLSHRFQVNLISPLKSKADFWLLRKKIYAKRCKETWLIELIGPSPAAGKWTKLDESKWEWVTRPGFEVFDTCPLRWVFTGSKPEYSWVINRWGFVSEDPALVLMKQNEVVEIRFQRSDRDTLEVTQNSDCAKSLFRQIKDTYDKKYLIPGKENAIPWVDQINSADLADADWNLDDLTPEEKALSKKPEGFEFATGVEAMLPCGLNGFVKSSQVSLLEYHEAEDIVSLGLASSLIELKEIIDVEITTENIGLSEKIVLRGVVTGKLPKDETGQTVVILTLLKDTQMPFAKIKKAVEQRQREIDSFFLHTKGLV